jgi:hypothetical protein
MAITLERLMRHLLIMGATGSGKTESALRLAWALAKCSDVPIFYLDGKADRQTARRFAALMTDAGRPTRVFPDDPLDGWRGEAHEIHNRLLEVIDYATDGPAAWYRDVAKAVLQLVCDHPDGPPRCSAHALERMDLRQLRTSSHLPGATVGLTDDLVRQVRLRYRAFFAQSRGALDGAWGWEDADAAYLLLDTLALKDEAGSLARFLLEDFSHYFTRRKPHDQLCLMVVDEFSSLAAAMSMAERIEQARGYRAALVLCPQSAAGLGEPREAQRILASVQTVVCHRVNTPEDVVALGGTRMVPELSTHVAPDGPTGAGSARMQHQFKVDPNDVRGLAPGEAWVISCGQATKCRMARAPQLTPPNAVACVPSARARSDDERDRGPEPTVRY